MAKFEMEMLYPSLPRTVRGQFLVMGADPKGQNFLYVNGRNVYIRNIEDPSRCDVYAEHSHDVQCAKYSPSGFYVASGDVAGKLRIWDTVNQEHILKNEFQPLGGVIKDIAWSADSQRIVVGGEGREKFGHVFTADSGNSVGEISGTSKPINSVDFKPTRPFRIVCGTEENTAIFFEGPPFKFSRSITDHKNFVQAVRFSPDGETFVSGSADGRVFVYDGKSAERLRELGDPAHKGGIYGLCYNSSGTQVLSVSAASKTAKIHAVDSGALVSELVFGKDIVDMQMGCLWQNNYLLTVSLSGYVNYLEADNGANLRVSKVLRGHNKPITAMAVVGDGRFATGDSSGRICLWDASNGHCSVIEGKGHQNQIQALAVQNNGSLLSSGMDNCVCSASLTNGQYEPVSIRVESQPNGMDVSANGLIAVACDEHVVLCRATQNLGSLKTESALCCSFSPDGNTLAVGFRNSTVGLFAIGAGNKLEKRRELKHTMEVTCVQFSPDGRYLAAADAARRVKLYEVSADYATKIDSQWTYHKARISTICFSPDSRLVASGGVDTYVNVFNTEKPASVLEIQNAHPMSPVTSVRWLANDQLLSAGQDSCIRRWKINV